MWFDQSTIYQIYPLGFCGVLDAERDPRRRSILKVIDWIPHMQKLGVDAVLFNPLFDSDYHGYDTRNLFKVDERLGSNDDFRQVCAQLHEAGMKVILDGVFNHVGRGFWAFQDVREKQQHSAYKDWFYLDFQKQNRFQDGFSYQFWETADLLVKLNLKNPAVEEHLFNAIQEWIHQYEIDGLRLDVAYLLEHSFLRNLRQKTSSWKADFLLLGELVAGDYKTWVNSEMLNSCTNYECYKGLFSSFNDLNLFEIAHSLNRQFASAPYALYRNQRLMNFADNHDVDRIASRLSKKEHLEPLYAILFGIPGVPCLYYGSEWGATGKKTTHKDEELRLSYDHPEWNTLTDLISQLIKIRKNEKALLNGDYSQLALNNQHFLFTREYQQDKVIVGVNINQNPLEIKIPLHNELWKNLLTGEEMTVNGSVFMEPDSFAYWKKVS